MELHSTLNSSKLSCFVRKSNLSVFHLFNIGVGQWLLHYSRPRYVIYAHDYATPPSNGTFITNLLQYMYQTIQVRCVMVREQLADSHSAHALCTKQYLETGLDTRDKSYIPIVERKGKHGELIDSELDVFVQYLSPNLDIWEDISFKHKYILRNNIIGSYRLYAFVQYSILSTIISVTSL